MEIGNIIAGIYTFLFFILFASIAYRISKREQPMFFWNESVKGANYEIDPSTVKNIKEYNRAHSIMWFLYSIPFAVAAITTIFGYGEITFAILISNGTIGIILLIWGNSYINSKYIKKCSDPPKLD